MEMNRHTRLYLRLQSSATGLLLAALLAMLAYAGYRYPVRWDWTLTSRHTLAEQSIQAIETFSDEIAATAYVQEQGDQRSKVSELLEKYRVANPILEIHYIDPDLDPAAARQAGVAMYGTIVLISGEKTEKVTETTEEAVTNGLIRLAKGEEKVISFLTGHGEHSLEGGGQAHHAPADLDGKSEGGNQARHEPVVPNGKGGPGSRARSAYTDAVTLLKGEGYQVTTLRLAEAEQVPDTTSVVVVAGPRTQLLPVEVERLQRWLSGGGRVLLMSDPNTRTGLEELLKADGVRFLDGTVVDPDARLFGGSLTTPLVNQYDNDHPITRELQADSFFPEARGLRVESAVPTTPARKVELVKLLSGAEHGWLKMGTFDPKTVEYNAATDQKGPFLFGVTIQEEEKRLVVLGDSDFAADAYIGFAGNTDLFLNMIRWLAEDEDFIAIKPKEIRDSGLVLSQGVGILLAVSIVVGIPLLLLGTGFAIWRKRKLR